LDPSVENEMFNKVPNYGRLKCVAQQLEPSRGVTASHAAYREDERPVVIQTRFRARNFGLEKNLQGCPCRAKKPRNATKCSGPPLVRHRGTVSSRDPTDEVDVIDDTTMVRVGHTAGPAVPLACPIARTKWHLSALRGAQTSATNMSDTQDIRASVLVEVTSLAFAYSRL
jgi:hypothetical protein